MTNRLAHESSPYLQQHADNPVDWYPWGPEALERAEAEDRPILLSVGYSACHWCHVMAHESFEDPGIAAKMNASFVNVKVDREERPDIDALYMEAVQAMTGHGGWPMTVVMTPGREPFFAGTYFPPTARRGMPGFGDLLDAIATAWRDQRGAIDDQAANVTEALRRHATLVPLPDLPDAALVIEAGEALIRGHDPTNGGFGDAPKFPSPMAIDVLFRHHVRSVGSGSEAGAGAVDGAGGRTEALRVAELTLDHMAAGGIYDHLGGGFARYSVDDHWAVPHFEKMLYDNALLVPAYLHGWQLTGQRRHLQVVEETIGYVLRDLRVDGGGFASAEDADSEGEEGRFYVWTEAELAAVLDPEELAVARDWYGVSAAGNFEGSNVLHRPVVAALDRPADVEAVRAKLFELRAHRIRPGLDDKVLTEWNALMISAMAEAGAAANRPAWVEAAAEAMGFLEAELYHDGRWYRSWQRTGGRRHLAYAADYAALTDAYTRLGEATGSRRWHEAALATAEAMLDLFWDGEAERSGGVLTVGRDAEPLLVDRKDVFDSPVPSANGNAALALRRVAAIWDRPDLIDRAATILRLLGPAMATNPLAHSRFLAAFDLVVGGMSEIVVTGDREDLLAEIRRRYLPDSVAVHGERFDSSIWADRDDPAGGRAYVCQNYTCGLPATEVDALAAQLDALR